MDEGSGIRVGFREGIGLGLGDWGSRIRLQGYTLPTPLSNRHSRCI